MLSVSLADIVSKLAHDANPLKEGFQPTPLYVFVCMALPLLMGILAGLLSSVVMAIVKRTGLGQERRGER